MRLTRAVGWRRVVALAGLSLAAPGLAACSRTTGAQGAGGGLNGAVPPIASSVPTVAGSWVTIPMGHLTDPRNTFWQLLFRPAGAATWSDQVTATDVATNGGLLLGTEFGAPAPGPVTVGIGSSGGLTFSPLIASGDNGVSWSDGLLPSGLAKRPSALALDAGSSLALVGGKNSRVLASAGNLSRWSTVTSAKTLAATSAGRSCRLATLSAVGYLGGMPVVGGDCRRAGRVALFIDAGGAWRSAGLQLPAALSDQRADVLGLEGAGQGIIALVELAGRGPVALVSAATSGPSQAWRLSPPLELAPGAQLTSIGPAGTGGLYALVAAPSGVLSLVETGGASDSWQAFPPPPSATAVVAVGSDGSVTALAARGAVLTVWTLPAGSTTWVAGQHSVIPIPYGSSG